MLTLLVHIALTSKVHVLCIMAVFVFANVISLLYSIIMMIRVIILTVFEIGLCENLSINIYTNYYTVSETV